MATLSNAYKPTQRVKESKEKKDYFQTKNKIKPKKKVNEMKISNLPDKDFK